MISIDRIEPLHYSLYLIILTINNFLYGIVIVYPRWLIVLLRMYTVFCSASIFWIGWCFTYSFHLLFFSFSWPPLWRHLWKLNKKKNMFNILLNLGRRWDDFFNLHIRECDVELSKVILVLDQDGDLSHTLAEAVRSFGLGADITAGSVLVQDQCLDVIVRPCLDVENGGSVALEKQRFIFRYKAKKSPNSKRTHARTKNSLTVHSVMGPFCPFMTTNLQEMGPKNTSGYPGVSTTKIPSPSSKWMLQLMLIGRAEAMDRDGGVDGIGVTETDVKTRVQISRNFASVGLWPVIIPRRMFTVNVNLKKARFFAPIK